MSGYSSGKVILLADDDPDDWILMKSALQETGIAIDLHMVKDGEELLDYLKCRGRYEDQGLAPEPDLILLDLNMPRKDGREALAEIKADQTLKRIPIVVFTTSREDQDILRCYELGANSYMTKPSSFGGTLEIAQTLCKYWLQTVELPSGVSPRSHSIENTKGQCRQGTFWSL